MVMFPTKQNGSDPVLEDWNAYFQLLFSGQLQEHRGEFIVVYQGRVVAAGADPEELRSNQSSHLGVEKDRLVVSFVDSGECIITE